MQLETYQFDFVASGEECTLVELVTRSRLTVDELQELIDCGAIMPVDAAESLPRFAPPAVSAAQTAARLRDELAIDIHAAALALRLLQRIRDLETQLRSMHARRPL